jgi:hypothetical protein
MSRFDTHPDQKMARTYPVSEQVPVQKLVSFNKHKSKHIINSFINTCPKNEQEVIEFFREEKKSSLEAKKFYNFYESIVWKLNGKNPITNWHACARSWILKADEIKKGLKSNSPSHYRDNLYTSKNKTMESRY